MSIFLRPLIFISGLLFGTILTLAFSSWDGGASFWKPRSPYGTQTKLKINESSSVEMNSALRKKWEPQEVVPDAYENVSGVGFGLETFNFRKQQKRSKKVPTSSVATISARVTLNDALCRDVGTNYSSGAGTNYSSTISIDTRPSARTTTATVSHAAEISRKNRTWTLFFFGV